MDPFHSFYPAGHNFDNVLYDFFKENCGLVEPPAVSPSNSGGRRHKGLENLRRKKQDAKKPSKTFASPGTLTTLPLF